MPRILLVDDDLRLAAMLRTYLEERGMTVEHAPDATAGLAALRRDPDVVVLDVMLPDLDGFEVLKRIRQSSDVGVVMLTARGEDTDRIVGLELGADDYLPKPFNPRELAARISAVFRRHAGPARIGVLRFGSLSIDRDERVVRVDGVVKPLTSHQFELLRVLAEAPGRVLSRGQIMERVRGEELEAFDRSIDVHVSRIRAAIEDDAKEPKRIRTVRGAGYVFTPSES